MTHIEFPQIGEVFFALCKSVNTPFSLGAWLRFKYCHKTLLDLVIFPENYETADAFQADYLVLSFLSKYKGLDTGLDLKAEALQRFTSSEEVCKETNLRFKSYRDRGYPAAVASLLFVAQRKISKLLGPYSSFKVNDSYGWGPGATSDISRRRAFVDTKMCQIPISVTPNALPIIRQEMGADLHWSASILGISPDDLTLPFCFLPHVFAIANECVIDTVPKNSKTHRVIAKENTANGFLQKGFGSYFRSRLLSVGVNLNDQSLNQRAALAAYTEGLATLDLKAASDTIALEVVFDLLPVDWALALDAVRSPYGVMPDGRRILLSKFSSMGNGFTFELESMIFWALTSAVADSVDDGRRVWIYGDDIVCPRNCASLLIELLNVCGFSVNTEKSFTDGSFFESCGKHYFKGQDVTPIYQKEIVVNDQELLRLGNRLIRCAHRFGGYDSLDKRLYAAWARTWRSAGHSAGFQLPLGTEGDDGWVVTAQYFTGRNQDVNLGIRCRIVTPLSISYPANESALLAWTLRRGVRTENPYLGDLTNAMPAKADGTKPMKIGSRWVMPTWDFGLDFS